MCVPSEKFGCFVKFFQNLEKHFYASCAGISFLFEEDFTGALVMFPLLLPVFAHHKKISAGEGGEEKKSTWLQIPGDGGIKSTPRSSLSLSAASLFCELTCLIDQALLLALSPLVPPHTPTPSL